jgi:YfiH family protein
VSGSEPRAAIRHPLLEAEGVTHGFGVKGAPVPRGMARPRQVHGVAVADLEPSGGLTHEEADAVVSALPARPIGIVTADCVPVLAAAAGGGAVAAIHAGWRGLAAGVVEAAIERLARVAGPGAQLVAVIGPRIGPCCYEVDEPVLSALRVRFDADLERATSPTSPGHAVLDLGGLVEQALLRSGISRSRVASLSGVCTACDPIRFDSYRRDGDRAGRLLHHIAAAGARGVALSEP